MRDVSQPGVARPTAARPGDQEPLAVRGWHARTARASLGVGPEKPPRAGWSHSFARILALPRNAIQAMFKSQAEVDAALAAVPGVFRFRLTVTADGNRLGIFVLTDGNILHVHWPAGGTPGKRNFTGANLRQPGDPVGEDFRGWNITGHAATPGLIDAARAQVVADLPADTWSGYGFWTAGANNDEVIRRRAEEESLRRSLQAREAKEKKAAARKAGRAKKAAEKAEAAETAEKARKAKARREKKQRQRARRKEKEAAAAEETSSVTSVEELEEAEELLPEAASSGQSSLAGAESSEEEGSDVDVEELAPDPAADLAEAQQTVDANAVEGGPARSAEALTFDPAMSRVVEERTTLRVRAGMTIPRAVFWSAVVLALAAIAWAAFWP